MSGYRFVRIGNHGIAIDSVQIYRVDHEDDPVKCKVYIHTGYHAFELEGAEAQEMALVLRENTHERSVQ